MQILLNNHNVHIPPAERIYSLLFVSDFESALLLRSSLICGGC